MGLSGGERISTIYLTASTQYSSVMDRQTGGRTDICRQGTCKTY